MLNQQQEEPNIQSPPVFISRKNLLFPLFRTCWLVSPTEAKMLNAKRQWPWVTQVPHAHLLQHMLAPLLLFQLCVSFLCPWVKLSFPSFLHLQPKLGI